MNPGKSEVHLSGTKENSLRIAHIITRMIIGGAQENTLLSVLGLQQEAQVRVDLITGCEIGPEGRLDLTGVKSVIFIPSLVRAIHPLKDFFCLIRLFLLFRSQNYDIVHTHSSKAGIIGRLAAFLAGVPVIVHTVHGLPFHPYEKKGVNGIYIFLERLCSRITRKIIVVSDQMRIKSLEKKIGSPAQYQTVFSGMRLEEFLEAGKLRSQMRHELNIPEDAIVIGKIARLFPLKGHEFILKIAKDLVAWDPRILFLWVGDGILKEAYQEQIKALGLEKHFLFAGLVKPETIPGYLSAMDFLVHVSLREGLARVIPQALAAGVPLVSFDIDGAKDIIKDGSNGFLVPPEDYEGLKSRLTLLIRSPELAEQFKKTGKPYVDPFFRDTYMVQELLKVYRGCL